MVNRIQHPFCKLCRLQFYNIISVHIWFPPLNIIVRLPDTSFKYNKSSINVHVHALWNIVHTFHRRRCQPAVDRGWYVITSERNVITCVLGSPGLRGPYFTRLRNAGRFQLSVQRLRKKNVFFASFLFGLFSKKLASRGKFVRHFYAHCLHFHVHRLTLPRELSHISPPFVRHFCAHCPTLSYPLSHTSMPVVTHFHVHSPTLPCHFPYNCHALSCVVLFLRAGSRNLLAVICSGGGKFSMILGSLISQK